MEKAPDIEPEVEAELVDDELDTVEGGGFFGAGGNGGNAGSNGGNGGNGGVGGFF